jgi:Tol biopolymer transport system component
MTDQDVRDFLECMAAEEPVPFLEPEPLARRARRRAARTVVVGAVGVAAAIAVLFAGVAEIRTAPAPIPADTPEPPSVDVGIFAPVAGRIVYCDSPDLWSVDPSAPSPVSTLELVGDRLCAPTDTWPLGWSSDGTQLLVVRQDPSDPEGRYLYILHADGTETKVTSGRVGGAAISPDGSRVVFAADKSDGMYVVDAEGGQPVRIANGEEPTFSPDGTQIAYLGLPRSGCCVASGREHVWVANADGTDAHEILTDEPALDKGVDSITWSPAGDRIAIGGYDGNHEAIYTFAPDGSQFTMAIPSGTHPHWSPDGSQIAYDLLYPGPYGVRIVDADGSNPRSLGVGSSGPWHPGTVENPAGG